MKKLLLIAALTLGGASVANAATPAALAAGNVPLCSKTITDSCMNPSQASHRASHHVRHHHHHAVARAVGSGADQAKMHK